MYDEAREATGHGLVKATIEGKKALKESCPEGYGAMKKTAGEYGGLAWDSILDYFEAQPEHIEIANLLSMLLSQRLKFHELAFKFCFKRKKPLLVLLTLMFKAHSLQHESLAANLKPLKFNEEEFEELRRIAMFPLNVYKVVEKEYKVKEKDETGNEVTKEVIEVGEDYIRERMGMIPEDSILYISQEDLIDNVQCPRFIIFTDTRSKSISICVRGTTTYVAFRPKKLLRLVYIL